jgi:hypothetical protein
MNQGLDYDSDEKADEEAAPNSNQPSELIDLGTGSSTGSKIAKNIPRLSGPN